MDNLYFDFNKNLAVEYAEKWALRRNPKFYDFEKIGGNCTNFVSQCIYAGAGIMNFTKNTGWYYISVNNRAPAWTGVNFLNNFLITNKGKGPFGRIINLGNNIEDIEISDIIQLSFGENIFSHSLIVTSIEAEILIATNSIDSLNRPLSTYEYEKKRIIRIEGVRK
ncbi:MAG: amidase domain-containing protein [Defluviitaleaceae bacterium]|nr:amidase domain-containing protein [Defluviitaleaceae bacterium]